MLNMRIEHGFSIYIVATVWYNKYCKEVTDMKQEKRIAFRCTEEEFENIRDQADCAGLNVTDYLKFLVIQDFEQINERG